MGYSPPSVLYEVVVDFGTTGLVGSVGYEVFDNLGATVIAHTTAGIIEQPANSGIYTGTLMAPGVEGQYSVVWDDGSGHFAVDELVVTSDAPVTVVGLPGTDLGPCSGWLDGDDVAACCESVAASDSTIFDSALQQAQELLFELSGRRFPGICEQTVRPCRSTCGCSWQVLSRGHIVWNPNLDSGWWTCNGDSCGCRPLSRVLLSGYVREVVEVLIDGVTVDPATYRVDNHRWLTRIRDPADPDTALSWPGCQALDVADDAEGAFAVTYTYGHNPPTSGTAAAAELACEVYKSCAGQECALPKGVVRLARQGVVMEKTAFASWGFETGKRGQQQKGWQTGMASVDLFLNAFAMSGLQRDPIFWSPASHLRYAQQAG